MSAATSDFDDLRMTLRRAGLAGEREVAAPQRTLYGTLNASGTAAVLALSLDGGRSSLVIDPIEPAR